MAAPGAPAQYDIRELAGMAQDAFEAGDYNLAVTTLESLKEKASDPKVAHNLAVARYYTGKTPNMDTFFAAATRAKRTMQGQDDADASASDDFDDEAECAVVSYNMAVIHYQQRHFNDALIMLERVFKIIEAVEETVAQTTCLLLLDLYIAKRLPEKALVILSYLDKTLANSVKQKEEKAPEKKDAGDGEGDDSHKSPDREMLKFYLHQYKARVHIMSRSMKAAKREVKSALNLSNQNVTALFLKGNFEYVRHNYRKSVKLLNSCPKSNPHVSGQSLAVLYYNNLGCIHFQMGKLTLAGFYFNKAIEANEREAGRSPQVAGSEHKLLGTAVSDRFPELLYNQGLTLLHMQKPRAAHKCFKAGLLFLSHQAHVWLRLAECCIMSHHQQRTESGNPDPHTVARVVGVAQNRKFVVKRCFRSDGQWSMEGPLSLGLAVSYLQNALQLLAGNATGAAADGAAATGAAAGGGGKGTKAAGGGTAGAASVSTAASASSAANAPPTSVATADLLSASLMQCHAKSNLAYAYLGLGDFNEALRLGEELLADKGCPGPLRFLAHVYMAEAYIKLQKISEAIQHLSPENVGDLSNKGGAPSTDESGGADSEVVPEGQPAPAFTVDSAKATLLLNLVAAYCIKGDFDQAFGCLGNVKMVTPGTPQALQAVLLTVYVELRRGNHAQALEIVKRHQRPGALL